jgi:hypothetical protein
VIRQPVDDLAFALIAPLEPKHTSIAIQEWIHVQHLSWFSIRAKQA